MSASVSASPLRLAGRLVFRRPAGAAENTRWLYAGLTVLALVVTLPSPLRAEHESTQLLAAVSMSALAASSCCVYLLRRVPIMFDVVDAVAITGFALSSVSPTVTFGYLFTAVWFRSLYGSTVRSLVRCGLYVAAIAVAVRIWDQIPGHLYPPQASTLLETLPLLVIVVIVGRQLGRSLVAREQSVRRDAILSATGALLLGVSDRQAIARIGWSALTDICVATPGLRLLKVIRESSVVRVDGAAGGFLSVPAMLSDDAVPAPTTAPGAVTSPSAGAKAELAVAVGARLSWVSVSLDVAGQDAWMLVGAPRKVPPDALVTLKSLINQAKLAVSSSEAHAEMTTQARLDALTGLANRSTFTQDVADQLELDSAPITRLPADGGTAQLHVLFLDLDDFKDVNDILGHRAGDNLLIEVARRLRSCTRPQDVCARLGGDEFAVVLHAISQRQAVEIAQRMVDAVAEPVLLSGRTARVGVSVGITVATPNIELEELIHQADVAMYAAKAQGKGRIQIFEPELLRSNTSRLSIERRLAAAAGAGELVVYYQPILALPGLRCIAVEALVRWQHPERGLLQPSTFIETAERTGAIIDIGAVVMRTACLEAARWLRNYPDGPQAVHVNVSPRQLDNDQFVTTVTSCLAESGLPPDLLVLELTETVVLNSTAAIGRLKTISSLGVKIAIDDFGTGYSCLSTLRSLPVNVIKLDRTFVAEAATNPADRTVIEAIVQMSEQLGLQTIAEGVERREQQRLLAELGIDAVQGYLHLPPVPAAELGPWRHQNMNTTAAPGNNVLPPRSA
jgi:diguanylate cyclase (GGDEF)-like protein